MALSLLPSQSFGGGMPKALTSLSIQSDSFRGTSLRRSSSQDLDLNYGFAQAAKNLSNNGDKTCFEFTQGILSRMNASEPLKYLKDQKWIVKAEIIHQSKTKLCEFELSTYPSDASSSTAFTTIVLAEDELTAHYAIRTLDYRLNKYLENIRSEKRMSEDANSHAAREIFNFTDYLTY